MVSTCGPRVILTKHATGGRGGLLTASAGAALAGGMRQAANGNAADGESEGHDASTPSAKVVLIVVIGRR